MEYFPNTHVENLLNGMSNAFAIHIQFSCIHMITQLENYLKQTIINLFNSLTHITPFQQVTILNALNYIFFTQVSNEEENNYNLI